MLKAWVHATQTLSPSCHGLTVCVKGQETLRGQDLTARTVSRLSACESRPLPAPSSRQESGDGCRERGPACLWVPRKNERKSNLCSALPGALHPDPRPGAVCPSAGADTRTHTHTHTQLLLLSRFRVSDSVRPRRGQPTRLPVPGILQAGALEWAAISFSRA